MQRNFEMIKVSNDHNENKITVLESEIQRISKLLKINEMEAEEKLQQTMAENSEKNKKLNNEIKKLKKMLNDLNTDDPTHQVIMKEVKKKN